MYASGVYYGLCCYHLLGITRCTGRWKILCAFKNILCLLFYFLSDTQPHSTVRICFCHKKNVLRYLSYFSCYQSLQFATKVVRKCYSLFGSFRCQVCRKFIYCHSVHKCLIIIEDLIGSLILLIKFIVCILILAFFF